MLWFGSKCRAPRGLRGRARATKELLTRSRRASTAPDGQPNCWVVETVIDFLCLNCQGRWVRGARLCRSCISLYEIAGADEFSDEYWAEAGFGPLDAALWGKHFGPAAARGWKKLGLTPGEALKWASVTRFDQIVAAGWIALGVSPDESQRWIETTGLDSTSAAPWIADGFDEPGAVAEWLVANVDVPEAVSRRSLALGPHDDLRSHPAAASLRKARMDVTLVNLVAAGWIALGVSPDESQRWIETTGLDSTSAAPWIADGFDEPGAVAEWLVANVDVPEAVSRRSLALGPHDDLRSHPAAASLRKARMDVTLVNLVAWFSLDGEEILDAIDSGFPDAASYLSGVHPDDEEHLINLTRVAKQPRALAALNRLDRNERAEVVALVKKWQDASAVAEWLALGLSVSQISEWKAAGFASGDAGVLATAGLSPRAAKSWTATGIGAADAAQWHAGGFDPVDATTWLTAGFTPKEAATWSRDGTSPAVASRRRAAGVRPPS